MPGCPNTTQILTQCVVLIDYGNQCNSYWSCTRVTDASISVALMSCFLVQPNFLQDRNKVVLKQKRVQFFFIFFLTIWGMTFFYHGKYCKLEGSSTLSWHVVNCNSTPSQRCAITEICWWHIILAQMPALTLLWLIQGSYYFTLICLLSDTYSKGASEAKAIVIRSCCKIISDPRFQYLSGINETCYSQHLTIAQCPPRLPSHGH